MIPRGEANQSYFKEKERSEKFSFFRNLVVIFWYKKRGIIDVDIGLIYSKFQWKNVNQHN